MYGAVLACVLAFYIMKPVAQHGVINGIITLKNRTHYDTDRQGDIPDDAPKDNGTVRQNRSQIEPYESADSSP